MGHRCPIVLSVKFDSSAQELHVLISKAEIPSINGLYTPFGGFNHCIKYKNDTGAIIFFDNGRWKANKDDDTNSFVYCMEPSRASRHLLSGQWSSENSGTCQVTVEERCKGKQVNVSARVISTDFKPAYAADGGYVYYPSVYNKKQCRIQKAGRWCKGECKIAIGLASDEKCWAESYGDHLDGLAGITGHSKGIVLQVIEPDGQLGQGQCEEMAMACVRNVPVYLCTTKTNGMGETVFQFWDPRIVKVQRVLKLEVEGNFVNPLVRELQKVRSLTPGYHVRCGWRGPCCLYVLRESVISEVTGCSPEMEAPIRQAYAAAFVHQLQLRLAEPSAVAPAAVCAGTSNLFKRVSHNKAPEAADGSSCTGQQCALVAPPDSALVAPPDSAGLTVIRRI